LASSTSAASMAGVSRGVKPYRE